MGQTVMERERAPPLLWRMDRHWERMRREVPHVRRPPSEYVREGVWFATQPIVEPERRMIFADNARAAYRID